MPGDLSWSHFSKFPHEINQIAPILSRFCHPSLRVCLKNPRAKSRQQRGLLCLVIILVVYSSVCKNTSAWFPYAATHLAHTWTGIPSRRPSRHYLNMCRRIIWAAVNFADKPAVVAGENTSCEHHLRWPATKCITWQLNFSRIPRYQNGEIRRDRWRT